MTNNDTRPVLTETDNRVAAQLRAGLTEASIATALDLAPTDVEESLQRLVAAGSITRTADTWSVQNVVGGYQQDRDDTGLTARYRAVRDGVLAKKTQAQIGRELGVSKQRVQQIVADLKKKGVLRG